ncbi:MAG: hypothetical protein ACOYM3_15595 [Terrimicrobiaceae bacterium]
MPADSLVKNWLHRIKAQFYPDTPKEFYQQRSMLISAITWPARYLEERKVRLPEQRIDDILTEIMRGIMHHGDTAHIGYFCKYYLKAVQDHMTHKGEKYYEEGKSLRFIVDSAMESLSKKQLAKIPAAQDQTTTELAALNRLVNSTKLKKKKPLAKSGGQLDLF